MFKAWLKRNLLLSNFFGCIPERARLYTKTRKKAGELSDVGMFGTWWKLYYQHQNRNHILIMPLCE